MNLSYNTTESISAELEKRQEGSEKAIDVTKIILMAAYVIIFLLSFTGNSLVIHIVRTRMKIRRNQFNWFLVNTAVADLVDVMTASAFSLPFFLCDDCWISGILGRILCKLIPFFLGVSICVSIWTLTVIAADRYLAIVCMQRKPLSPRSVVRSIIAVWLLAGVMLCEQLYKFKTKEIDGGEYVCYSEWHDYSLEMSIIFSKAEMVVKVVITYVVPLVVITILYSLIAYFLWRHKPPGHANHQVFINQTRRRRAVIKMLTTAVTVFALCWLPVHVSHIMSEFYSDAYDAIPTILRWLFYWLAHANAAIHPWLFIFFSENLRVETKRIFRNIWNANQLRLRTVNMPSLLTDLNISAPGAYRVRRSPDIAVNTV